MRASVRDRVFEMVAHGHDPHVACITAGAKIEDFERDPDLKRQLSESFRIGTARLKQKLTESALRDSDTRALERLVEQREQQFGTREEASRSQSNLDVLRKELAAEVERHREAHRQALRAELLAELAATGGLAGKVEPSPLRPLAMLNEAEPLPSYRAPIPFEPPPPPRSRGYRLPKALGPDAPWATTGGDEYPL